MRLGHLLLLRFASLIQFFFSGSSRKVLLARRNASISLYSPHHHLFYTVSSTPSHPSPIFGLSSTMATFSLSTPDPPKELLIPLHIAFIEALDKKRDSLAYHFTTHLRMNGVYWGLTALEILGKPEVLDRQALIDFVFSCWNDQTGGFGSFPGHDAHVHSSLSAIQILAMKDALTELEERRLRDRLIDCKSQRSMFSNGEEVC